jgi:hypothetical protein
MLGDASIAGRAEHGIREALRLMTDAGVYRFKLMVVSDLQLHGVVHATRRCFVDDAAEYLPVPYRRTERHEDLLSAFVWPLVPGLVRPVRL